MNNKTNVYIFRALSVNGVVAHVVELALGDANVRAAVEQQGRLRLTVPVKTFVVGVLELDPVESHVPCLLNCYWELFLTLKKKITFCSKLKIWNK